MVKVWRGWPLVLPQLDADIEERIASMCSSADCVVGSYATWPGGSWTTPEPVNAAALLQTRRGKTSFSTEKELYSLCQLHNHETSLT